MVVDRAVVTEQLDKDVVSRGLEPTATAPAHALVRQIGRTASFVVLVVGVLILFGFEFNIQQLVHPFGSHTAEHRDIYISYVLLGVALVLAPGWGSLNKFPIVAARCLALAIIIVEAINLHSPILQTRIDLILAGVAILGLTIQHAVARRIGHFAILLIAASAMTSMVANTYKLAYLSDWAFVSAQSLIASVLFYFSAFALLFSQPEAGPAAIFVSSSLGGVLARRLLLPILLIYPFLGFITGPGPRYRMDLTVIVLLTNLGLPLLIWLLAIVLKNEERAKLRAQELLVSNLTLNKNLAELLTSEARLKEALNARSQFVARVSHELRTPLAAIIGATELSLAGPQSEEQRALTKIAHDSGQSLLRLVNDLLDFSRVDVHKLQLQMSAFQVKRLVESTLSTLESKAKAKRLAITSIIASDVPDIVVGDEGRFKQILVNLVDNAIKFTERGFIQVELTSSTHEDRTFLRCSVMDTGIGIAPDQQARIFEPFTQLDDAMTRSFQGAGLGLTITKSLVELMSGSLDVTSSPGQGSVFSFEIPLQTPDLLSKSAGLLDGTESDAKPASDVGDIILIVEDSAVNAKILTMQIRKLGYQCETVSNGKEAVEAVATRHYALILMDWQMPVMDGIEATKTIRCMESPAARCVPIIALTAHAMDEHRATCLRAGMNDYLSKPVSLERLQKAIRRWMPKESSRSAGDSGLSVEFRNQGLSLAN